MRALVAAVAVVLALAGCTAGEEPVATPSPAAPEESPSEAPSPTPSETPTPTPSPTEEVEASAGPPEQCVAATSAETEGDPIVAAAHTAALPEAVALRPGVQVIHSTEVEGASEVVVRICSEPLSDDEHREVATSIARAVYAANLGVDITRFYVTSWVPDGDTIQQGEPLSVEDFGLYLWDSETANVDAFWE